MTGKLDITSMDIVFIEWEINFFTYSILALFFTNSSHRTFTNYLDCILQIGKGSTTSFFYNKYVFDAHLSKGLNSPAG